MKNKSKKKLVFAPQKYYPGQINFVKFVVNNGGRIIAAAESRGVSRKLSIFNMFSNEITETYTVLCLCQSELSDILMMNVCKEFDFGKKGKGMAFKLDILGYMGAKGPFVE